MAATHIEAVSFSFKAAIAAIVATLSYRYCNLPGSAWVATVSAVLVTQPDLHASWKASLLRVAANLGGALIGLILLELIGHPLVAMALGIVLTGVVCHWFKLDDALRPAFVAVIIVTLIGDTGKWQQGSDRVLGVIIGCVCALVVGFLFDIFSSVG